MLARIELISKVGLVLCDANEVRSYGVGVGAAVIYAHWLSRGRKDQGGSCAHVLMMEWLDEGACVIYKIGGCFYGMKNKWS